MKIFFFCYIKNVRDVIQQSSTLRNIEHHKQVQPSLAQSILLYSSKQSKIKTSILDEIRLHKRLQNYKDQERSKKKPKKYPNSNDLDTQKLHHQNESLSLNQNVKSYIIKVWQSSNLVFCQKYQHVLYLLASQIMSKIVSLSCPISPISLSKI